MMNKGHFICILEYQTFIVGDLMNDEVDIVYIMAGRETPLIDC